MTSDQSDPEQISFKQILNLILGGWRIILFATVLCAAVGLFEGRPTLPVYRSYYVVMPANVPTAAAAGGDLVLFGLGGGSGAPKGPDWEMYQSLTSSTTFAQHLIDTTSILQLLFRGSWDPIKKSWITKVDFWPLSITGKIRWLFGERTRRVPDKFALRDYLQGSLQFTAVPATSQIMVEFDSPDPATALKVLTIYHHAANDTVRQIKLKASIEQRTSLLQELSTTTVSDYRQTLLGMLERTETTVMTANLSSEYAAILLDGPVSLPDPTTSSPLRYVELSISAGVIGSLVLIVFFGVSDSQLFSAWRRLRRNGKAISRGKFSIRDVERSP